MYTHTYIYIYAQAAPGGPYGASPIHHVYLHWWGGLCLGGSRALTLRRLRKNILALLAPTASPRTKHAQTQSLRVFNFWDMPYGPGNFTL